MRHTLPYSHECGINAYNYWFENCFESRDQSVPAYWNWLVENYRAVITHEDPDTLLLNFVSEQDKIMFLLRWS